MRNIIPTLTLATTLALAALGEAAPRKTQPVTPNLTATEEVCLHLGGVSHSSALLRDKGLSYLETLQRLRKVMATNTTSGPWIDWFHAAALANLRVVYDYPSWTPTQARQDTELACVRVMERHQIPMQTITTKDRY